VSGEITLQQLNDAIDGTSSNSNAEVTLDLTLSDPPTQAEMQQVIDKVNELINALRRQSASLLAVMSERLIRRAHLPQPLFEVVVVGDAFDETATQLEKRSDAQPVALTCRGREPLIGRQVFALDEELGGTTRAIFVCKHDEITHLLAVAAVHALQKGAEGGLSGLHPALVDVVHDLLGQQREKRGSVAGIEGVVVPLNESAGLLLRS
jgi:hypothetical protein